MMNYLFIKAYQLTYMKYIRKMKNNERNNKKRIKNNNKKTKK